MMRTCRTLYNAGALYMLKDGVRLDGYPSNMYSFNSFMLQNRTMRCSLVRKLFLDSPMGWCDDTSDERFQLEDSVLRVFCGIIQDCRNLRHLELVLFEGWLDLERSMIWSTFSSLHTLKYVLVESADPRVGKLLQMWVDLKWLCIVCVSPSLSVYVAPAADPRLLIRDLHNLRELSLEYPFFSAHKALKFPHLETLCIDEWAVIKIKHLIESFPNIRNLHFRAADLQFSEHQTLTTTHTRNMSWQNISNRRWPILSYYRGDAKALYALAPQCKITHVHTVLLDKISPYYLRAILEEAMPSHLTLCVQSANIVSDLPAAVPEAIELPLTHLNLTIEVPTQDTYTLKQLQVGPFLSMSD